MVKREARVRGELVRVRGRVELMSGGQERSEMKVSVRARVRSWGW